jgi:glycosyltransferase involved in cell wall biosynthesis
MHLSLIIPAYNEEKRIETTLANYSDFLEKHAKNYEIIVVCDGCIDNTEKLVCIAANRNKNIKILTFDHKLGKGGAIIEGFSNATGEIVGFSDADEAVSPEDFFKLVNEMDSMDCTIASRMAEGSIILNKQSFTRRTASRAFNLIVNLLFNLHIKDTQCGAKVLRRKTLDGLPNFRTMGFEFDVELLWRVKKSGSTIKEVPITWSHVKSSKFSLWQSPKMFYNLVKLRYHG